MKFEPENLEEIKNIVSNKVGILVVPDTELESKLNLLYVIMNTSNGELVNDYEFGIDFTNRMHDIMNTENNDFEFQIMDILKIKTKKYLPDITLVDIETHLTSNNLSNPSASLVVKCLWSYRDKYSFNSISVIKTNDKFGSLLSNVVQYEQSNDKPSDVISRKVMVNMINTIMEQLETGIQ